MEAQRVELKKLAEVGFPKLWKEDGSPISESKFLKHIQEDSENIEDIDSLLSSFDEVNLFKFFYQWVKMGVTLQQLLHKHG